METWTYLTLRGVLSLHILGVHFSEARTESKAGAALELRDRVTVIKHVETDTCPSVLRVGRTAWQGFRS